MSDRRLASRKVRRMQTTEGRQAETPTDRRARLAELRQAAAARSRLRRTPIAGGVTVISESRAMTLTEFEAATAKLKEALGRVR